MYENQLLINTCPKTMIFCVKYFKENDTDCENYLGEENSLNIDEILLHNYDENELNQKKIYLNKKFSSSPSYRWKLLEVKEVQYDEKYCLHIVITPHNSAYEEFLLKTLRRNEKLNRGGLGNILHKGKLVEIEFGHPFRIYKINKDIKSNKRYTSTVQNREMNKRRLGIIVKVYKNKTVQVVPITSVIQSDDDKSCFKLEEATLMPTNYFSAEKSSWALCSMIQTISISRILPVEVKPRYRPKGISSHPRPNNYPLKISKADGINLDKALLHAINLGKYEVLYDEKNELEQEIIELNKRIEDLERYEAFCKKENMNPDDYL